MKRVFAIIIAFILCLNTAFSIADSVSFTPTLANSIKLNAREWMDNVEKRAVLTVLMMMEVMNLEEVQFSIDATKPSYVGRSGLNIFIVFLSSEVTDKYGLVVYSPSQGTATCSLMDGDSNESDMKYRIESILSLMCEDGSFQNDVADIASALSTVGDAFGFSD